MFQGPTMKTKNIAQKKKVMPLKILLKTKLIKDFHGWGKMFSKTQFWFFFGLYHVKWITVYCRVKDGFHLLFKSYYISKSIPFT